MTDNDDDSENKHTKNRKTTEDEGGWEHDGP